jgi:hypothetical protein
MAANWAGHLCAGATLVLALHGCSRAEEPGTSDRLVHMPSGDSIEVVGVGPAVVPDRPAGLLFTFHPFKPVTDTIGIQRLAAEVWRVRVRPQLSSPPPDFVVLQATSRRAGPVVGLVQVVNYGVVLERRGDGQWYYISTSKEAD